MDSPPAADQPQLVSRSVQLNGELPPFRDLLDAMAAPRTVWDGPTEPTVIASGAAATLTAEGPERFTHIKDAAEELFSSGDVHAGTEAACPRLFGGFTFHAAEPSAADRAAVDTDGGCPPEAEPTPWSAFPDARFVFPRLQVTITDRGPWLTVNAVGPKASVEAVETRLEAERERIASVPAADPETPRPGIAARRRTTTPDSWRAGVTAATDRIADGSLQKVVLAQALEVDLAADLAVGDILSRLGEKYPSCNRFLTEPAGDEPPAFFGATPERLVSLRGRTVETDALAGTTGRGETPAEDEWLARELLDDTKNVHEHQLVAETICEQLEPFAASISVGDRQIRRLATVQHIHTPITAELAADTHVLDLVEALHPTPAVGGLPPDLALETIGETEPFDRGWYAAPIGWIDAAGNGTFAVASGRR